jgi:hypothetical protein
LRLTLVTVSVPAALSTSSSGAMVSMLRGPDAVSTSVPGGKHSSMMMNVKGNGLSAL